MSRIAATVHPYIAASIVGFLFIFIEKSLFFLDHLAINGFSPIGWIAKLSHPQNFSADFPSGIENYDLSTFMQVYRGLDIIGVPASASLYIVLAIEGAFFISAIVHLIRSLAPGKGSELKIAIVSLLLLSQTATVSIARFGFPFFYGQFYVPSEALRIFAISYTVRGNIFLSVICLILSFSIHPVIGVIGGVMLAPLFLPNWRQLINQRAVLIVSAMLGSVGLFMKFKMSQLVAGAAVPGNEFTTVTKVMNYHFHPVSLGLFTHNVTDSVIPFFSLLLTAWYCFRTLGNEAIKRNFNQLAFGFFLLAALTVAGVAISELSTNPTLIKLCLHRASSLLSLFALIACASLLAERVYKAEWAKISTFLLFLFLTTVFLSGSPYTLIVGAGFALADSYERGFSLIKSQRVYVLGLAVIVLYLSTLSLAGYRVKFDGPAILIPFGFKLRELLVLFSVYLMWHYSVRVKDQLRAGTLVACLLVLLLFHIYFKSIPKPEVRARARDYMAAQVWANKHTPGDTLFMPPPTLVHGWRDFSERSSFGNYREWLMTSWLYNSNLELFKEGRRRFSEFGDVNLVLQSSNFEQKAGEMLNQKYNDLNSGIHKSLALKYGISYFIFETSSMRPPNFPGEVFRNRYFVIVKSEAL